MLKAVCSFERMKRGTQFWIMDVKIYIIDNPNCLVICLRYELRFFFQRLVFCSERWETVSSQKEDERTAALHVTLVTVRRWSLKPFLNDSSSVLQLKGVRCSLYECKQSSHHKRDFLMVYQQDTYYTEVTWVGQPTEEGHVNLLRGPKGHCLPSL